MIDLIEIWNGLGWNGECPAHHLAKPDFIRCHAARANLCLEILRPAQIMVEKSEGASVPSFQFHPRPDVASSRAWAWILAVRSGALSYAAQERENRIGHMEFGLTNDWRLHWFKEFSNIVERCRDDAAHHARLEVFTGPEIDDLIALSPDCTRVLGRFTAATPVLGWPLNPVFLGDGHKVRLFRNVRTWFENLCGGAVLIGEPHEAYDYLAACEHGIITDNVAHGERIRKILTRPYTGPQVLVAA